jgi:hypothetical protein
MRKQEPHTRLRQQYLVEEISAVLHDTTHLKFYRTIARRIHDQFIWKVLSEIKHDDPTEIGDPVVYFITQIHHAASAEGISLETGDGLPQNG